MKHHNRKHKKTNRAKSPLVDDRQPVAQSVAEPVVETRSEMPPEVEAEIQAGKAMFEQMVEEGPKDEHYESILSTLEDVIIQQDEQQKLRAGYIFNQEEFVDACDHVVADQLSALKKEKIDSKEFAVRFNRWFAFCDAVVNLGMSCLYSKDALKDKEYETVFKTLKLNKQFETMFLKPRGLKIELRHKSQMVMDKYPWLAMPVLVIRDEQGVEHEVAITPSPNASVWWLDILAGFHGSYDWVLTPEFDEEDFVPVSTLDDPYPEGTIRDPSIDPDDELPVRETSYGQLKHFGVLSTLNPVNKETIVARKEPIRAFGETEQRIYMPPADYVREPVVEKPLPIWKRMWNRVKAWFTK